MRRARRALDTVADQPAPARQFPPQPARRSGRSGSSSSSSSSRSVAEFIANDRPLIASYKGEILFPVVVNYPETKFGGFLAITQYRDRFIADEINANGWMLWPPVRFSYRTADDCAAGCRAVAAVVAADRRGALRPLSRWASTIPAATSATGTGSAPTTRAATSSRACIYGFRISVLFGLILTVLSSVIGVVAGAVQGYFGGWVDLIFQRVIEIWTSIPSLYLLLIISSVLAPSFWVLLGILLLFSWVALVGVVRAEFLRGRNFEYVAAARALGVSNWTIMWRHLLPNAMVATLTFMPFILGGSITTLTSLDFLGFGLPPGSPSLGELLAQGKNNLQAPWLGHHRLPRHLAHAEPPRLHRRGGARRVRSAEDLPMSEPLLSIRDLRVDFGHGRQASSRRCGASRSTSSRARPWRWSASPARASR